MFEKLKNLFRKEPIVAEPGFKCPCCGKETHVWPSIAYMEPTYYSMLSADDKDKIATLKSDSCIIKYVDESNYFIRCVIFQDVIESGTQLHYGPWVSLSEKSFNDYILNFDDNQREGKYFGWISNNLMGYENTIAIPADVYLRKNGSRPEIMPHEDFDHPFVKDYYDGISMEEAHRRIEALLSINI